MSPWAQEAGSQAQSDGTDDGAASYPQSGRAICWHLSEMFLEPFNIGWLLLTAGTSVCLVGEFARTDQ
eukprot:6198635-Pleurochrysis_carterae.AAC.1